MATTNSYTIWQNSSFSPPLTAALATLPTHQAGFSCGESIGSKGSPGDPLRRQLACRAELECGIGQIPQSNANSNGKSAWIPIHLSPVILYHISYTLRNLETIDNHSIVWDLFIFRAQSWGVLMTTEAGTHPHMYHNLMWWPCTCRMSAHKGENWVCLKTGVSMKNSKCND